MWEGDDLTTENGSVAQLKQRMVEAGGWLEIRGMMIALCSGGISHSYVAIGKASPVSTAAQIFSYGCKYKLKFT